jgi:hypothetical protein
VVARSDTVIQIGSEPPGQFLLHHAPAGSVDILKSLDGTVSAAQLLHRYHADEQLWTELLVRLLNAQLLIAAADWSFPGPAAEPSLQPERDSLVHRHGVAVARRVIQARQDAVVVVRGSGRLATSVATALAVAGVGHVHQQPDRALRPADLAESARPDRAGIGAPDTPMAGFGSGIGAPTRADAVRLAANLRRAVPSVKVHAPAAHHRVVLVVLAGDGPPAPSLAAELTDRRIPHLAVTATRKRSVVGPFVLPGRSSCLVCALHHRADLDQTRPAFEEGLRHDLVVPPVQLVCSATALAVADALDHLDGITVPVTVDGTVEWQLGELGPRRRSWSIHPNCGCSSLPSAGTEDFATDPRPTR